MHETAHSTVHNNAHVEFECCDKLDDAHIEFECHGELNDDVIVAEPDRDTIEPLAHELNILEVLEGDWAAQVEEQIGFGIQGEYVQDPHSPAPFCAPWYPSPPP